MQGLHGCTCIPYAAAFTALRETPRLTETLRIRRSFPGDIMSGTEGPGTVLPQFAGPLTESLAINYGVYVLGWALATLWLRAASRLRPGWPRLLGAAPVLIACEMSPWLFDRDRDYIVTFLVAFTTTWLAALKVSGRLGIALELCSCGCAAYFGKHLDTGKPRLHAGCWLGAGPWAPCGGPCRHPAVCNRLEFARVGHPSQYGSLFWFLWPRDACCSGVGLRSAVSACSGAHSTDGWRCRAACAAVRVAVGIPDGAAPDSPACTHPSRPQRRSRALAGGAWAKKPAAHSTC